MAALLARRRGMASLVVFALVVGLIGWFAARSQGATVHEADLSDGAVWISSDKNGAVGRINKAIGQLDAAVYPVKVGAKTDVAQDGGAVVAIDGTAGVMTPIDVRRGSQLSAKANFAVTSANTTGERAFAPRNVDLRGGTIAIVDPKSGKVWAQRVDPVRGIKDLAGLAQTNKPRMTVGAGAFLTVDVAGNVHAVSTVAGVVMTLPARGEGFGKPTKQSIKLDPKAVDISAVGTRWVVYDSITDQIQFQGGSEPVDAGLKQTEGQVTYAALQQPSAASDFVAIASSTQMRLVALGDGESGNGGVTLPEADGVSGNDIGAIVARPVVVGGCAHAVWSNSASIFYNANCGQEQALTAAAIAAPVEGKRVQGVSFRLNRSVLVINDQDAGVAYDPQNMQHKIDQWETLTPPTTRKDDDTKDKNTQEDQQRREPPKAERDTMRVRPSRTSRLHVLDNDNDPTGGILSIKPDAITDPKVDGVAVAVSADGQAINLTVSDRPAKSTFTFRYTVNNGKEEASADVEVSLVGPDQNNPPVLRPGASQLKTEVPVMPGGQVAVQAIGDWRDPENDTVSLEAGSAASSVDGIGRLNVVARTKPGTFPAPFTVVDDLGASSEGQIRMRVLDPVKSKPVAPKAVADATRGIVGKPIQIEPLANDRPGADPTDPDAAMALVTAVQGSGSLKAETDLDTGVVTLTASAPGTFLLPYAVRQGTVVDSDQIRVDITAPPSDAPPPTAVPDNAVLRDQSPTLVDVLANDSSPRSDVLVTLQAAPDAREDSWLKATVFQGRWVRIESTEPAGLGASAVRRGTLRYTVSDGAKRATGQISVVQRGPLSNQLPVVKDDTAKVRVGDVVSIPVLDNDTMAGGIPIRIDPASVKVVAGGKKANAFVSGNVIRYVPEEPTTLLKAKQVVLEYAAYPEGNLALAQTGRVTVAVQPLPTKSNPNQAPVARSVTASVVAGESLAITVPTTGIDVDGDSATVTGVSGEDGNAIDLRLGRVVSFGASTIRYEAYPRAAGTEVIRYLVKDRFGGESAGLIRVGVVQPGDPQPPVAVEDTVLAAPGKKVHVSFTDNDLMSRTAGQVLVDVEGLNDKDVLREWKVDTGDFIASTTTPKVGERRQLTYGLDDGVFDPSRAAIVVVGVAGHKNPPTATDDVAKPKFGETSTLVDVLGNDTDVDSDPGQLRIAEVLSPEGVVEAGKVRVKILDHPHVVPYVIADPDGEKSMALIYVPTGDKGLPYVVADKVIDIDADSSRDVEINEFVKSPRNRPVTVTAVRTLSTSPAGNLDVDLGDRDTLELTSRNGYVGPAAVMLEVTDRPAGVDPASPEGQDSGTAFVSIPVQVGPKVAVLRCPNMSVTLVGGGRERVVDIASLCNAWVPIGMDLDAVRFTSRWLSQPEGASLRAENAGDRTLRLSADADAPSGAGQIEIGVEGSQEKSRINVTVQSTRRDGNSAQAVDLDGDGKPDVDLDGDGKPDTEPEAAAPTVRPISIQGLEQGSSQTVDLRAYLNSPLTDGQCAVLSATVESGKGLSATSSGCSVTVSVGSQPSLQGAVALRVTDKPGSDRVANGRITVTMLGRPGTPSSISATPDRVAGGQVRVYYTPPAYNGGSPITHYRVTWTGGGTGELKCTASPCTVTGLVNGKDYFFSARAVNSVGESEKAAGPSSAARPDTKPEAPNPPTMTGRGDGYLDLAWTAPVNKGSAIVKYNVNVLSGTRSQNFSTAGPVTTFRATGLVNNEEQQVKVQAVNEVGAGPWSAATAMQSAGQPAPVGTLQVATDPPADATQTAARLTWAATDPNGPPLDHYTVHRRVAGSAFAVIARVSGGTTAFNDTVPYDGRRYEWMVTATNGAGGAGDEPRFTSTPGNVAGFVATGKPETPLVRVTTPDANYKAVVTVQLGQPRSTSYSRLEWRTSAGDGGAVAYTGGAGIFTFTTSRLAVADQRLELIAINAGGERASGWSGSYKPYGPTLTPEGLSSGRSGDTITWTWRTPQNGRPINQTQVQVERGDGANMVDRTFGEDRTQFSFTGDKGRTYRLRVRVHSVAGWSSWTGWDGQAIPEPEPSLVIDGRGQKRTGVCSNCYEIAWHGVNVKAGGYNFACFRQGRSDAFYTGQVTMGPAGGHSGDWCAIDPNLTSQVRVVISGGPSGTVGSAWSNW